MRWRPRRWAWRSGGWGWSEGAGVSFEEAVGVGLGSVEEVVGARGEGVK